MVELEVIEDPATAANALNPVRARLLDELGEPRSASGLAELLGLSRQKVNYHLRSLESHGLAEVVGERRWGGLTEWLFQSKAESFLVSPRAMPGSPPDPVKAGDRRSAVGLVALAARAVGEVGRLIRGAAAADQRLATFSLDTQITFRSPAEFAAFSEELTATVAGLAARYHDEDGEGSRRHRFVAFSHPTQRDEQE